MVDPVERHGPPVHSKDGAGMEHGHSKRDDEAWLAGPMTAMPTLMTSSLLDSTSTIALVGKGSSGKSTLAIALAVTASKVHGLRVLIIDADLQNRSIVAWGITRAATQALLWEKLGTKAALPRVDIAIATGAGEILRPFAPRNGGVRSRDYDLVILDFPGAPSEMRSRWLGVADLTLLPVEATPVSVWATLRILTDCRALGAKPFGIVNKATRGSRPQETVDALKSQNLAFGPHVRAYVAHQDALAHGYSVIEARPEHAAAADMSELYDWCISRLREDSNDRAVDTRSRRGRATS